MNGPAPVGLWQEATAADGKVYYYNTQTRATQWTKPEDLWTPAEQQAFATALATTPWQSVTDKNTGRKYWHNKETNETSWDLPEVVKQAVQKQQAQQTQAPTFVAGGEANYQLQHYNHNQDRDGYHHRHQDRQHHDRHGGFGQDRIPVTLNSQTDPEYATVEEAEAAFMKALKRAQVQPDWKWEQAIHATIKDPQYRALKDPKDREDAFKKYCIEAKNQEKERERDRLAKLKADFTSMLRSHPEIKYYTRWKSALPIISNESIFRSAQDETERRQLFQEHIKTLKAEHDAKEADDIKTGKKELTRLLESLNLDGYTTMATLYEKLENNPEFNGSKLLKGLHKSEVLKTLEDYAKKIEQQQVDKRQQEKHAQIRRERQNRDSFIKLLEDLKVAGRLKIGTKWKDIYPLIEDDPRYTAMLGQQGSTPLDLFWDALEEEEKHLRELQAEVKDILEEIDFKITLETNLEDFLSAVQAHPRAAAIDSASMSLIFQRLIEKLKRRQTEAKANQEHTINRAYDDLKLRLEQLEPPVSVGDTWDQVRPRIERSEEYRTVGSDDIRRAAFDKYMRRLERGDLEPHRGHRRSHRDRDRGDRERDRDRDRDHERDRADRRRERERGTRDREYRNGHTDSHRRRRTRTRSPEPDAYEADRQKAIADRESRFRQSTKEERDRPRDRHDRSVRQGSVYERERRERDTERERLYIDRADPRDRGTTTELDYGDSRPVSSRRRRESDVGSPGSRRDSKRARREINSRERTYSPRRDRRSKTPAQTQEAPTVAKEDPGLRSGSEEGEIEED